LALQDFSTPAGQRRRHCRHV